MRRVDGAVKGDNVREEDMIAENFALRELVEMGAGIGIRRGLPATVLEILARGHRLNQVAQSRVVTVVVFAALPALMAAVLR